MKQGNNYYRLSKTQKKTLSDQDLKMFYDMRDAVFTKQFVPKDVYEKIGYEVLGPILFGYVRWLNKQIIETRADVVLFLSREGKLLEKAYKSIFKETFDTRIEYVNVSRLALAKATISNVNTWDEFVEKYKSLFRGLTTIEELLSLFEIRLPDESFKMLGLRDKVRLSEIENKDCFFSEIKKYGRDSFIEQNQLAKEYLKSKGVGKGTTIVADIGWAGTMQAFFAELFPSERFIGAYIAVGDSATSEMHLELERRGFWFGPSCDDRWQMIRFTISAFEFMFLNSEGTTIGYMKNDSGVYPIKEKVKYTKYECIDRAHAASIRYVCDMNEKTLPADMGNPNIWFVPYYNFAIRPGKETISFFKGFKANNGVKEYSFLPEHLGGYYFFHLKKAFKEFELNNCKIIWLYGLLPVAIPYYELLCFLTGKIGFKSEYCKKYLQ